VYKVLHSAGAPLLLQEKVEAAADVESTITHPQQVVVANKLKKALVLQDI
jgi:hypothetical protein